MFEKPAPVEPVAEDELPGEAAEEQAPVKMLRFFVNNDIKEICLEGEDF